MEDRKTIIGEKTAISIGIVFLIVTGAVSYGIMNEKVTSIQAMLNQGNYEKRITTLETTIPQINQSLSDIKNQQIEVLKLIKK